MIPRTHKFLLEFVAVATCLASVLSVDGQDKRAKEFEKLVAGHDPLFVDGERVYRPNEVSQPAVVTLKPEPQYTDKAHKKILKAQF